MQKENLYNTLNKEELIARLESEDFNRATISFYRYTNIQDPQNFRDQIFREWDKFSCSINLRGEKYILDFIYDVVFDLSR
ncbi:MAG: hypothetical protein CL663_08530, partial [Bacteroidetes bacterium]|nr:hypothetical protein [Bacteroidota bacterium]